MEWQGCLLNVTNFLTLTFYKHVTPVNYFAQDPFIHFMFQIITLCQCRLSQNKFKKHYKPSTTIIIPKPKQQLVKLAMCKLYKKADYLTGTLNSLN